MEKMAENQEIKLVNDESRGASISDNHETTGNNDNNHDKVDEPEKTENSDKQIDYESIAFKSQFDEIINATRLLENARTNNYSYNYNHNYNRHHNPHTRTSSLPSLNGRGIENSYFTHQKPYSIQYQDQQSSKQNPNHHNQAKHKRNNASISKLNLNGISNSYFPTISKNFKMNSSPSTPYIGYDLFDELSFDDAFDLKSSLRELDYNNNKINNSRHDSDWEFLSGSQGYAATNSLLSPPPLTPSSINSSSSSSYSPNLSPYYTPTSTKTNYHHLFLDDKEFLAQQLLLEEERKLLEIQQIQLNDAIAALRSETENSNNGNNFDSSFKQSFVQRPLTQSSLNNNNPRFKPSSSSHNNKPSSSQISNYFSSTSSQSRYCHQEPIGTPVRKSSSPNSNNNHIHNISDVKPISISTALFSLCTQSPSLSPSSNPNPSFSLFSKSPSSSIDNDNNNSGVDDKNTNGAANNNSDINNDNNVDSNVDSPPTMSSTPVTSAAPQNNRNNSNFNSSSSLNILDPKFHNNNNNLNYKHHDNLFYNNLMIATAFDEREEDLLLWTDGSFDNKFDKSNNNLKHKYGHHHNHHHHHHHHHSNSSGLIV